MSADPKPLLVNVLVDDVPMAHDDGPAVAISPDGLLTARDFPVDSTAEPFIVEDDGPCTEPDCAACAENRDVEDVRKLALKAGDWISLTNAVGVAPGDFATFLQGGVSLTWPARAQLRKVLASRGITEGAES